MARAAGARCVLSLLHIEVLLASIATRMACLSALQQSPGRPRSERGRRVRLMLRKGLRAEVIR